ncbi:MAG: acetyl-CoA carboxylase biotin carboxyl carrier protein subunit [Pseudobdellovibrionaceae bacterium]|nr:acetyl-CoA carboxylase biotin carboxyl carrier protein subunit [Bdellovibrionales bacterium]USN46887.1 MAG: acetyl-CoA carboxylase biotin carboxyl carrier protein subunit [Pseudobdellovibrionaceae bacterium]
MYFQAETNNKKYEITVNETKSSWKVGIKPENHDWVHYDISKQDYQYLDQTISFIFNNSSYLVDVVNNGLDHTVYTRGSFRTVMIYNEERLLHESLKAGANFGGSDNLTSGMPGKIVKVFVEEGQEVKADEPLLIMEAMKMENEMRASHDLVIDKIHVSPGQNVEGGALLISFR